MKRQVKLFSNPKTEAQHQMNVIRWSQKVRDKYPELALLYHIPNGGNRDRVEGQHLKEQGVKSGVPDLHLPCPRGIYHGMYIEMKTEWGTESDNQVWWRERLTKQGYFAAVCRGWGSATRVIEWYLNLSTPSAAGDPVRGP